MFKKLKKIIFCDMEHNLLIVVRENEAIKLKIVNMLAFNEEDMLYITLCPLVQHSMVLFLVWKGILSSQCLPCCEFRISY
jgi:hypothetical protein